MQQVLANCEDRMKKSVSALETDYLALRTGRASAAIFDTVRVDYYGQETPLNQVASISVPEARLVVIQPWDKSLLSIIEREAPSVALIITKRTGNLSISPWSFNLSQSILP